MGQIGRSREGTQSNLSPAVAKSLRGQWYSPSERVIVFLVCRTRQQVTRLRMEKADEPSDKS